jgi:hypothetical protein
MKSLFLAGLLLGTASAAKAPDIIKCHTYGDFNGATNSGWTYKCLTIDARDHTVTPNYGNKDCWPPKPVGLDGAGVGDGHGLQTDNCWFDASGKHCGPDKSDWLDSPGVEPGWHVDAKLNPDGTVTLVPPIDAAQTGSGAVIGDAGLMSGDCYVGFSQSPLPNWDTPRRNAFSLLRRSAMRCTGNRANVLSPARRGSGNGVLRWSMALLSSRRHHYLCRHHARNLDGRRRKEVLPQAPNRLKRQQSS